MHERIMTLHSRSLTGNGCGCPLAMKQMLTLSNKVIPGIIINHPRHKVGASGERVCDMFVAMGGEIW